jgi:mono/diheme cytochrome c family protein
VDEATLDVGRQIFAADAAPPCAICHTLADAEASGEVGPNLDQLQPALEMVRRAVTDGVGIMPSYGGTLSPEQIEAVALYVSQVAGQGS